LPSSRGNKVRKNGKNIFTSGKKRVQNSMQIFATKIYSKKREKNIIHLFGAAAIFFWRVK
jgi:hypothetical protein